MSSLSSPLHQAEGIAMNSPVTTFHSFAGHQMETQTMF